MKKTILLVMVFIGWPATSNQALADKPNRTLVLASAKDWTPYIFIDAEGKVTGTDFVLLEQVLQQLGVTLKSENLPEQRLAIRLEKGTVDIVLGAALTLERQSHNYFSIPYRKETIVLGYRKSRYPQYRSATIAEVLHANKVVALNKSGWFGELLSDQLIIRYKENIVHAEGTQRRMQLLMLDRVDAIVGDVNVLMTAAQALGFEDLAVSEIPVHQTDVHFMFGQKQVNADFVEQFNQALERLIATDDQPLIIQ